MITKPEQIGNFFSDGDTTELSVTTFSVITNLETFMLEFLLSRHETPIPIWRLCLENLRAYTVTHGLTDKKEDSRLKFREGPRPGVNEILNIFKSMVKTDTRR